MLSQVHLSKLLAGVAVAGCLVAVAACGAPSTTSGDADHGVEVSDTQGDDPTDETADTAEDSTDEESELSDFVITLDGAPTTVAGADTNGDMSLEKSPVAISVTDVTCGTKTAADVGSNDDNEPVALTAPSGEQLCLVTVTVKNTGKSPAFWSASNTQMTLQDGTSWAMYDGGWSGQQIAQERDKPYAGDADLINPGKTEYDYLLFSIPDDQEPAGLVEPNNGF